MGCAPQLRSWELRTQRLRLVAATAQLCRAEGDGARLGRQLGARVPASWPPRAMARALVAWRDELQRLPELRGWTTWYWLWAPPSGVAVLVGGGGFKGPPDDCGQVEIGYALVPEHRRQGFAGEAAAALARWAFGDGRVRRIDAETEPSNGPSIRLLRRLGFRPLPATDPETLRFGLERPPGPAPA